MSARRRREKAARNREAVARMPAVQALVAEAHDDWVRSGRMACSYGAHEVEPVRDDDGVVRRWRCPRCGASYFYPEPLRPG